MTLFVYQTIANTKPNLLLQTRKCVETHLSLRMSMYVNVHTLKMASQPSCQPIHVTP